MESDFQRHHHLFHDHHQQNRHQKQTNNSGLTRYQSAPSTYFSSFLDDFLNKPSSPETESIFARLLASSGMNTTDNIADQNIEPVIKQESPVQEPVLPVNQIMGSMVGSDQTRLQHQQQQEQQKLHKQRATFSCNFYQSQSKPPLPDKNSSAGMDNRVASSIGRERLAQMKPSGGQNSSLVRHSSSPAGLFSNINIEMDSGYAVVRGIGDFETGNRETAYSAATCPENAAVGETGGSNYASGFPVASWDDRTVMSASLKGLTDDDRTFSGPTASVNQVDEAASRPPLLAHHLSLPKTSAELSAIEKYLQDSVPCKIRAKRGCATHPRSIAERVRRTRISERMRKLQDLVPNMEKQTNTSDMLDFAVDYIKDLQRQVKVLSENRSKCTCSSKQQREI